MSVIDRIADLSRDRGVKHVLVAGDVFDTESGKSSLYHQPIAKLQSHRHVIWHLLPGNHDPAREDGGIWPLILGAGLPENVRVYTEPGKHEISPGVQLLVSPLTSKAMSGDPTAWMASADGPGDDIRIGLAHGSVEDFGGDESSNLIARDRVQTAGLSYLALGDWHGLKEINQRCWYSGTPEPEGWRQNDPGHVLVVEIGDGNSFPVVEAVRTGHYVWHEREIDVSEEGEFSHALKEIDALVTQPDRLLLKLRLNGIVSPERFAAIELRIGELEDRYRAVIRRERGLETRVVKKDIEALSADPTLYLAAKGLMEEAQDADETLREVGARALQQLFLYKARLDGEAGS